MVHVCKSWQISHRVYCTSKSLHAPESGHCRGDCRLEPRAGHASHASLASGAAPPEISPSDLRGGDTHAFSAGWS